uniref:Vezatin n=1 Tax=Graphocephala atropunctata TaxID=36148 RepID=A0A1B6ME56_9HEMI
MSEDEEIICKGHDLYSHLVDQGFKDFGTYKPSSMENEYCANDSSNKCTTTLICDPKYSNNPNVTVTACDSDVLQTILTCQLLFKEDADLLEAVTSNVHIKNGKKNFYVYFGAVFAGFFSTLVTLKKGLNVWLPAGITLLTTTFSSWFFYKEYQEIYHVNVLKTHIVTLQKLCSSIHRLLRHLKETEILSMGQVSVHNVGAAMYMPTQIHEMKNLAALPTWKTLPHLRTHLVDALLEMIKILSQSCDSLRCVSPSWLVEGDEISLRESLMSIDVLSSSDQTLSIKNLQLINEVYLVVQSEYLRRIALNISPVIWEGSINLKDNAKKETFEVISNVHSQVTDIFLKMKLLNNFHNSFSRSDKVREIHVDVTKSCKKEISMMKVEAHNIYLLILSLLLKVRSLEDYLEDIFNKEDHNNKDIKADVTRQITSLRDDLANAVKCYDILIYQALSKNKTNPQESERVTVIPEPNSRETGIVVGTSDFNVNTPDDVFLATSGLNIESYDSPLEEWCLERKPQIPKTLLTELSNTLKSRKKEFNQREKIAMERKGLQDIENPSDVSDTECKDGRSIHKQSDNTIKLLRKSQILQSKDTNSSDSDGEHIKYKRKVVSRRLKDCRNHPSGSMSESEISSDPEGDIIFGSNLPNTSSLANLAALKSQQWRQTPEECFSDG